MLKEITLHCERGWGNEHGERENEKWKQKRELEMKLLLGFIFIFPVTNLVARSPLTSQLYMNIDFKRGEYNIFLRIYYLSRISFLADCFILHIYMTWDTKKIIKMHWSDEWTVTNQNSFFIGRCDYFAIQSPWGTTRMLFKGLRPHPHKTGHFSTRIFVYPDSCGQSLKLLWKAVSKRCGFGERINWLCADDEPIREQICGFKKYPDSSGRALNETHNCSYHKWLLKRGDAKWKQNSSEQ